MDRRDEYFFYRQFNLFSWFPLVTLATWVESLPPVSDNLEGSEAFYVYLPGLEINVIMNQMLEKLAALWEGSSEPPDIFAFLEAQNGALPEDLVSVICLDQRYRWRTGAPLTVEDYLERMPHFIRDRGSVIRLVVSEYTLREEVGTSPRLDEYITRFSDFREELRAALVGLGAGEPQGAVSETSMATVLGEVEGGFGALGRYRLLSPLGEGEFGCVFRALDEELGRHVAIKVPRAKHFQKPEDAQQYLDEARKVAKLDHPNIVSVYDMGRTESGAVFVVSKYIEGMTLSARLKQGLPSLDTAVTWLNSLALGLHHAHERCLVHRDVKPGNILLEGESETPYLADFGLAIQSGDLQHRGVIAGTIAYMSPEQTLGEVGSLDGRSDIFSLGVVFYEMLTGQRPFSGSDYELLRHVRESVPRSPCDFNERIPAELASICLRCLEKDPRKRFVSCQELSNALTSWQAVLSGKLQITNEESALKMLAAYAGVWGMNPKTKHLPSLVTWLQIRRLIDAAHWSAGERKMMKSASRHHFRKLSAGCFALISLTLFVGIGLRGRESQSKRNDVTRTVEREQSLHDDSVAQASADSPKVESPEEELSDLNARYLEAVNPAEKLSLAYKLADLGQIEIVYLISRIDDVNEEDSGLFIQSLSKDLARSIDALERAAIQCDADHLWQRKARIGLVALGLGNLTIPLGVCATEGKTNHEARSWFIEEFPRWMAVSEELLLAVTEIESAALRSAICLGLGGMDVSGLGEDVRLGFVALAGRWFASEDAATHLGAAWMLQRWKYPLPEITNLGDGDSIQDWFINSQNITMVRIIPSDSGSTRGSEAGLIPEREYWIANREIAEADFREFVTDQNDRGSKFRLMQLQRFKEAQRDLQADYPIVDASWFEAVRFCNWLSEREGRSVVYRFPDYEKQQGLFSRLRPWDSPPPLLGGFENPGEISEQEVHIEVNPDADGYRLPTEVEWEYACRAGADTKWSFGNDRKLYEKYAQAYPEDSTVSCGVKLPNAWGLHDMHGNASEWCTDSVSSGETGNMRAYRGGSYTNGVDDCLATSRRIGNPSQGYPSVGFRIVCAGPSIKSLSEVGSDLDELADIDGESDEVGIQRPDSTEGFRLLRGKPNSKTKDGEPGRPLRDKLFGPPQRDQEVD